MSLSRWHSFLLLGFLALLGSHPVDANGVYRGGNGDGFSSRDIGPVTLDGTSLVFLFGGGKGDGFFRGQLPGATLSGPSTQILYRGSGSGSGDGFGSHILAGATLSGQSVGILFGGTGSGNGDGFDARTASTSVTGQSFGVLFAGGNGDGFASLSASGLALIPEFDSDGDLMPNDWENLYTFLDPHDPGDAALDFDKDGMSNLEEYLADTVPDDNTSFFSVRIRPDGGGGREIYFDSSINRFYRVETGGDLKTWNLGPWVSGTGAEMFQALPSGDKRFGRVRVAPSATD